MPKTAPSNKYATEDEKRRLSAIEIEVNALTDQITNLEAERRAIRRKIADREDARQTSIYDNLVRK